MCTYKSIRIKDLSTSQGILEEQDASTIESDASFFGVQVVENQDDILKESNKIENEKKKLFMKLKARSMKTTKKLRL